jgi:hypothetical protein
MQQSAEMLCPYTTSQMLTVKKYTKKVTVTPADL